MHLTLPELDNLKVYNHNTGIFYKLERVGDIVENIGTLWEATYQADILIPPNETGFIVQYLLELYISDNATGTKTAVIVHPRGDGGTIDLPPGGTGELPAGGTVRIIMVAYFHPVLEDLNPALKNIGEDNQGRLTWKEETIVGLPSGGEKGQVVIKKSNHDFDAEFNDNIPISDEFIKSLFDNDDNS